MFYQNSPLGFGAVPRFGVIGQGPPFGLFLGNAEGARRMFRQYAQEAQIEMHADLWRNGVKHAKLSGPRFIMKVASKGLGEQDDPFFGRGHHAIFDTMAFFLPRIVRLLGVFPGGPTDRAFRPIDKHLLHAGKPA
jgi:hypothetical protein